MTGTQIIHDHRREKLKTLLALLLSIYLPADDEAEVVAGAAMVRLILAQLLLLGLKPALSGEKQLERVV